ncbi:MAG: hypothetical protein Q8876_05685 [Bacillota bacterium]|nr:hypothetical protein [Bacillota bacterium]
MNAYYAQWDDLDESVDEEIDHDISFFDSFELTEEDIIDMSEDDKFIPEEDRSYLFATQEESLWYM